jgi:hypothetical protein
MVSFKIECRSKRFIESDQILKIQLLILVLSQAEVSPNPRTGLKTNLFKCNAELICYVLWGCTHKHDVLSYSIRRHKYPLVQYDESVTRRNNCTIEIGNDNHAANSFNYMKILYTNISSDSFHRTYRSSHAFSFYAINQIQHTQ